MEKLKKIKKVEIEDKKTYVCNEEVYEGLVLSFCIEYEVCATCKHLYGLKEQFGKCMGCEKGVNFEIAEFEESVE